MPLAFIVYGRYAILKEKYIDFLRKSQDFIEVCRELKFIIPEIYLYIYKAISLNKLASSKESMNALKTAWRMSVSDSIILPFVENYQELKSMVPLIQIEYQDKEFIEKIEKAYGIYSAGSTSIISNVLTKISDETFTKSRQNLYYSMDNTNGKKYNLTQREINVAHLVSEGRKDDEISEILEIPLSTVKFDLRKIFKKMNIKKRQLIKGVLFHEE